jgi:hypothetical protein
MRKGFHITDAFLKTWIVVLIIIALSCGAFLQAYASAQAAPAGMPVIQVTGVIPQGYVQLLISNLPANTEFAVTMGPVDSQGLGGLVAHFISPAAGGSGLYWFEIENLVRMLPRAEVRIDSGSGYVAWAAFDNSAPVIPLSPIVAVTATPAATIDQSAVSPTATPNKIQVLHVQKGGLVVVLLHDLPLNRDYTVRIGKGGSRGENGYVVAGMPTADRTLNIAYFEIPVLLRAEATLDLRIDGANAIYLLTFNNQDF